MDLQQVLNSELSINLVYWIGRTTPQRLGRSIATFLADIVASRRNSVLMRGLRTNQWVARGETLSGSALDLAARETIRNTAWSMLDLYRHYQRESAHQMLVLDEGSKALINRLEHADRGVFVAGFHLSGFDLALQTLNVQGMRMMVLTIPDPKGSHLVEYERRRRMGMNIHPVSYESLHQGVETLKAGGLVLSGVDRPIPDAARRPLFFGRPASLPTHHIHLALKAQVPVVVMAVTRREDGRYSVNTSEPIEMVRSADREREILLNAERVLQVGQDLIKRIPQQWSISLPVWPELIGTV